MSELCGNCGKPLRPKPDSCCSYPWEPARPAPPAAPTDEQWVLAEELHNVYEQLSVRCGWKTQEQCQVPFERLPHTNRQVMLGMADFVLARAESELEKLRQIADEYSEHKLMCGQAERREPSELQAENQRLQRQNDRLRGGLTHTLSHLAIPRTLKTLVCPDCELSEAALSEKGSKS